MKTKTYFILLLFCLFSVIGRAQEKEGLVYTNTNILEIYVNSKDNLWEHGNIHKSSWGFEFNSFHGFYILKKFVLAAGIGVNINYNVNYHAIPISLQLAFNLFDYGYNSPYVAINLGRNIAIGSFSPGKTAKLTLGYKFENFSDFQYVIEVFKKSKTYTATKEKDYNFFVNGVGLSVGINF